MSAPGLVRRTHAGGCHCGAVRFRFEGPDRVEVFDCNCSMCRMTGHLHWFVEVADFRLLAGEDALSEYRFNTGAARHLFCRHCGVKSFYVPRSHPDGYSVNARCVDPATVEALTVTPFDGRHWETSVAALRNRTGHR